MPDKLPSVRATASVQVTLEIDAGSPWGSDCRLDQVHSQAKQDVENTLRNIQQALRGSNIRVLSIGPVRTIITREER